MVPSGQLMAVDDPPSLWRATARQAAHGKIVCFQFLFKTFENFEEGVGAKIDRLDGNAFVCGMDGF